MEFDLLKEVDCTKEERMECLLICKEMYDIAIKVRNTLLDVLEKELVPEDEFLRLGIKLIFEGVSRRNVEKILKNCIINSRAKGKELLKRLIILEGILHIQKGTKPKQVYLVLLSYVGIEFCTEYTCDESNSGQFSYE